MGAPSILRRLAAVAAALALAGCAAVPGNRPASADGLSTIEAELTHDIDVLASDDFGGRRPGTEGEAKTLRYLAQQWQVAGLESGTNDPSSPWFAPVALELGTPARGSATFWRGRRVVEVPVGGVHVYTSGRRSLLERSPTVFVGEEGEALDRAELAGRVAVMLWDHDGRIEQREALLEKGAAAVIAIVGDPVELRDLVERRDKGTYRLAGEEGGGTLEALISRAAAEALIGDEKLATLMERAASADFAPVRLDLETRLEAASSTGEVRTYNLIAKLPGNHPEAGTVLLLAHWDHFGRCAEGEGPAVVCHGAVDNASGLAVLDALARRLGKGPRLDRDVYFLATTAEEWGLLGARAFTQDPPVPLETIVAAFNVDSIAVAPKGTGVAVVGNGMTALDGEISAIAARMGREVVEPQYANRYVRRQDGWALLQHDVPALMVSSAFADRGALERYNAERYHRPTDVADAVELGGAAEDVLLHLALVRHFATIAAHPGPSEKSPSTP